MTGEVEGENESNEWWWVGALVYVTGSVFINLGSNLIRFSHEKLKLLSPSDYPPFYKRYWWLLGFGVFAFGNIFNFIGFMFAAQSLLVGLGSIQFVSNLLFAHFVNKESITKKAMVATGVIIIGNIFIVTFGSKTSETFDIYQLLDLFIQPAYLIYISIILILIFLFQSSYLYILYRIIPKGDTHPLYLRYMPFAYAAVSTMVGTWSVTISKALSGIVLQSIDGSVPGQFRTIYPYLLIFFAVLITLFWLYRMNSALRSYDAMFIIPVLQALWLLFGVLGGGIFFEEFSHLDPYQMFFFIVGVLILLFGVCILSPNTSAGVEEVENNNKDSSIVVVYTRSLPPLSPPSINSNNKNNNNNDYNTSNESMKYTESMSLLGSDNS